MPRKGEPSTKRSAITGNSLRHGWAITDLATLCQGPLSVASLFVRTKGRCKKSTRGPRIASSAGRKVNP
jgi:hypothetical protein